MNIQSNTAVNMAFDLIRGVLSVDDEISSDDCKKIHDKLTEIQRDILVARANMEKTKKKNNKTKKRN